MTPVFKKEDELNEENYHPVSVLSQLLQGWFCENHMVLNPGKCHYSIINKYITNESIQLGKKTLHAEAEQKIFGIIIDNALNFQSYTRAIIKTAN